MGKPKLNKSTGLYNQGGGKRNNAPSKISDFFKSKKRKKNKGTAIKDQSVIDNLKANTTKSSIKTSRKSGELKEAKESYRNDGLTRKQARIKAKRDVAIKALNTRKNILTEHKANKLKQSNARKEARNNVKPDTKPVTTTKTTPTTTTTTTSKEEKEEVTKREKASVRGRANQVARSKAIKAGKDSYMRIDEDGNTKEVGFKGTVESRKKAKADTAGK
jgi:hypothetical protein|tara:strand:- start:352 stop:1005 length:654 start_codon:yes stop_codon:yes gene_type:complete